MSIFIGYWCDAREGRPLDELQRLLSASVSGLSSSELKIHFDTFSSECADVLPSSRIGFGIAAHGRHATIQSEQQSLCVTLAAGGAGFESDAWASVSHDGLVLGRNVFGRVQIFWTIIKDAVWFSNRLQLLLPRATSPKISINGFYSYGCFSYVPAPYTPIENIFAVRAGTTLTWKNLHAAPTSHNLHEWREADEQSDDETSEARRLRRLLEESVEAQLANYSGEPVGVFLSGGLDSSVTAALLARAGAKVRAYTLDLRGDCFSEVAYAELVARTLGIPLTKIPITGTHMRRSLASTAARLDGLFGDGVTVPLAMMFRRASKDVRIVYNGEGGDQLFAGWTNKPLIAASIYQGPDAFFESYLRTFHRFYGYETKVYTESLRQIDSTAVLTPVADALDPAYSRSLLHRLRRANLLLKGADNIQPRATNLGLSYNLDVRTLFCAVPLADWTFGVSSNLWLRGGCEKYLLKRAVEDLLPPEIIWREKRGMGIPLTGWLTGPLRRWWQRQLHPRRIGSEGLWQADLANEISRGELSGHIQGRRIGELLWLMLMWGAWRERLLPNKSRSLEDASSRAWRFSPLPQLLKRT